MDSTPSSGVSAAYRLAYRPELTGILLLLERDLDRAARHPLQRVNQLGGSDNITLALVRVVDPGECSHGGGVDDATVDPVRGAP